MSFENTSFIDSQSSDVIPLHDIRLPFPPPFITVSDFINKRELSSRIFRKSPNAFFIYRKAFTNHLTFLNYKLTMIDVSRLVSNYWKKETKEVKEAYAKIAKEIDVELKEKRKHDKKLPVIWKIDKKIKKQKRNSKRNLKNNSTNNNNSSIKFRNTTEITFEYFSTPDNEPNQKFLRSPQELDSQSSLENSPDPVSPLMEFPGIVQGYNFVNYDNSCKSSLNGSEEENYDSQSTYNNCGQNLNQVYGSRLNTIGAPEYNNLVNYDININGNIFVPYNPYNWDMSDPCMRI